MPVIDRLKQLESLFKVWERDRGLSGGVLVTQAGSTLFEGAYGFADRARGSHVTPRTRFGLASVTKMFTAVAICDLVAAASLRFDTAVIDVLPPAQQPSTLDPEVTVHHLLTHTSGIADYAEEAEDSPGYLSDYGNLWVDRPSYRMERPADFLPLFSDLEPYRPPGQRWQYSNAGFIVLGLVIEEITGRPYTEVVQERVFDRAEMNASGFFRLDEARADVAVGYLPDRSPDGLWRSNIYMIPVIGGADGGAFSTTHDLDQFLRRHADGTLLGSVQTVALTRHVDVGHGYHSGYGVLHYPDASYGHGGGDPGVEVLVRRFPDQDANVIVLCNGEGLAGEVRDSILEALQFGS